MTPSQSQLVLALVLASAAYISGMQAYVDQERSSFLSATVGDNISFPCFYKNKVKLNAKLYWYKKSLGMKPKLLSSFFKVDQSKQLYDEFHMSRRFTVDYQHDKNYLKIKNVQMSDSAVYLCIYSALHQLEILESITLFVKDLDITAEVRQSPNEDTDPGRSVTLKCSVHTGSCDGAHRVYWFKQSEESAAGVLYSHGDSSDQCGINTNSQTENSCVYSLPIHNVSPEQTGTYYCAVASCGQVLFGNGTRVKEKRVNLIVYVLTGALGFTSVLVVLLGFSLLIISMKYSSLPTELKDQSGTTGEGWAPEADHVHYAAVNINPSSRRQRSTVQTECVYSDIHLR